MTRSRIPLLALALAVFGIALGAAVPAAVAQSGPQAAVDVRGNAFVPASITVLVGTTVTWTQRDVIEHTVTVDDNQPEDWDRGILLPANPGGVLNTFRHTFNALGTTAYHCEIHANMVGEVTVVESFDSPFVTVNANDGNEFSPEFVEINETEGVLWINSGTIAHTVTFEDASIGDFGELLAGEQVRFNFTEPGSYRYRCTYHSRSDFESGMVGKVVVGGNATFPTVVIIEKPADGETVTGSFDVSGRVVRGTGADNLSLDYRVDSDGNWTSINISDEPLAEFTWRFSVNSTGWANGEHLVAVRALVAGVEAALAEVRVASNNTVDDDPDGGGTPGPTAPLVAVVFVAAAYGLRRRRRA
jgi:MYXO-CTERM domain-containing protein